MLDKKDFIIKSLELNLFFQRIFKEHSIFLEASFTPKNQNLIYTSEVFKNQFTKLLYETISLSRCAGLTDVLNSQEIVTQYTLPAEKATEYFTGIYIDSRLTGFELSLETEKCSKDLSLLTQRVQLLNNQSISAANSLATFKLTLLNNVLSCKLYTTAYPLLIDHILREAKFYVMLLKRLQSGVVTDLKKDLLEQELFWNRIMAEHSFFIRGLLDPSEEELFDMANNFGKEFNELEKQALAFNKSNEDFSVLTAETTKAVSELSGFKAKGTDGILNCKIKSIIVPLLGDHVLREANHYLRLLKEYDSLV